MYAVILNQKLINKSKKKEQKSLSKHVKRKRKKDSVAEKETVKLTTDIDRPFTMVSRVKYFQKYGQSKKIGFYTQNVR